MRKVNTYQSRLDDNEADETVEMRRYTMIFDIRLPSAPAKEYDVDRRH